MQSKVDLKKDILWRVYLCFLGIVALCACVLGRAIYIQTVQGSYWRGLSDSLHQKFVELDAERGTVYSEDGNMLSTSVPFFNIYIDFAAQGIRERNGRVFKQNLDSLTYCLARLFKDQSAAAYKRELLQGYRAKDRYFTFKTNLSFEQYKLFRNFPLIRSGRNKSGFITEVNSRRLNPFGLLANRTIGLARVNAQNVGLERTYDEYLRGENGSRLVRYMAAGTYIPVEGYEIEPENGKDIVTTLNVNIQDIAENALLSKLAENDCEQGTCIIMEVATGRIKAIANLAKQQDGSYWEDLNYAIRASEPGSTFKLVTLLSLLEDHAVALTDHVDLEKGIWKVGNRTIHDAERHERNDVTVKEAFELSSNVGMAKLAMNSYSKDPVQFVEHLKRLRLNQMTGIDLVGETQPIIKSPRSKTWSATTLPWMAFGYEVLVSPLQTLTLYNAVANDGKMMKPYLVDNVESAGRIIKQNEPSTLLNPICTEKTLQELKECLKGVCLEGTAKNVFKSSFYQVAGKTGTSLVAKGNRGYADHIYQSSFVGFFPADQPRYSCIVVIKNKPHAPKYTGAAVAAPVFKVIADQLMSRENIHPESVIPMVNAEAWKRDSLEYYYAGSLQGMKIVLQTLALDFTDSGGKSEWGTLYEKDHQPVLKKEMVNKRIMPDVRGMGLKDALYLLENLNMKVASRGIGKVKMQSIEPGTSILKNQTITLDLN
jgi:cell division protein FtsI (penicillin-binding protein 3)